MTKRISEITVLNLLAAALVALPALSRAEGTNAVAASGQTMQPGLKTPDTLPFHAKLSAVDTNAATLTVGDLVLHVNSDTKITRDGKPAALANGVVGEMVGGAYLKAADGQLNATVVYLGLKAENRPENKPEYKHGGKHKVPLEAGDKQ
jgi:hypothetical protein